MTVRLPDPATEDCRAISSILARVGDKWTVLIVVLLGDGPKRFNEIRRMVGGIHRGCSRSRCVDWSETAW
jgi:DNA-binding HxlR family transcriptional regulator